MSCAIIPNQLRFWLNDSQPRPVSRGAEGEEVGRFALNDIPPALRGNSIEDRESVVFFFSLFFLLFPPPFIQRDKYCRFIIEIKIESGERGKRQQVSFLFSSGSGSGAGFSRVFEFWRSSMNVEFEIRATNWIFLFWFEWRGGESRRLITRRYSISLAIKRLLIHVCMHPAVSRFSHKHLICNNEDGRSVLNRGNSEDRKENGTRFWKHLPCKF